MKANDCLRRLRYILDYKDTKIVAVFARAEQNVALVDVTAWLKKDDDPAFAVCPDIMLAAFLNGLINERRGKQDGPQPVPETSLNNNLVLRKLKIAFNLQAGDILELLATQGVRLSKHELSAFFRRPDHKHYRDCKDQVLRNFLAALQQQFRGPARAGGSSHSPESERASESESVWPKR